MARKRLSAELPVADRARRLSRELTQQRADEGGLAFVEAFGVKGFLERKQLVIEVMTDLRVSTCAGKVLNATTCFF